MFCDGCGVAMAAGQQFCGACGKQIGVAPAARPGAAIAGDGRVAKHLTTVAALWVAVAALTLLAAVVLLVIGLFPFDRFIPHNLGLDDATTVTGVATVTGLIHTLFLIGGVVVLAIAGVHFVAAWGLLHHAPWARILTIAFAFLRILELPLGTALGIYTIWVLMGPSSEQEYRALGPRLIASD
jgi:hypothetical protein